LTNFGASGGRRRASLPGRRPVIPAVTASVLVCGVLTAVGLTAQAAAASPLPACGAPVISAGTATVTCGYTGAAQYFTVPAGVTQATFTLYGAEGGASTSGEAGGLGAEVTAALPVSGGTVLQVNAGQAGGTNDGLSPFNGGGPNGGSAGDGGGGTDVRSPAADGSYPETSSLLVAGGGGGAGADGASAGGPGGSADSPGAGGQAAAEGFIGGGGGGGAGTTTSPGGGGGGGYSPLGSGAAGSPGGTGASQGAGGAGAPGGGGGGGGFYGGGGGGQGAAAFLGPGAGSGGGGGGASYTGTVPGATVNDGIAAPDDAPNGEVIITYTPVAPLDVTTTSLPAATLGKPYSATLTAVGGVSPYTWSITAGALPTGLSLDAATGVISGTPVVLGSDGFTVGVKDSETPPMTASQALSITAGGCTTTVTGSHPGSLTVGSGVTCIVQASIGGSVSISAGATVAVSQSTVSGALQSSRAGTLSVCGSSIAGPLSVSGSTGFVLVGDAGDDGTPGCGPNTISGPAALANNTAGVQLGGDTIHGPVSLSGNSGGPGTEVEANHIGGPLACSGNNPAPTDNSQPNTVSGPTAGQCTGLA
jgi:Putative Ig domain